MSEPEHFLTRWSRKKREAELEAERKNEQSPVVALEQEQTKDADKPPAEERDEPEIDLSTLPSLESIGADTDIRAFLQRGVPSDLTRAALRRVWAADPAIRDFIGIAENQYDFASGDIPGFGPLKAVDDVARMVADIAREGFNAIDPEPAEPKAEPATETAETAPASGDFHPVETISSQEFVPVAKDQTDPQTVSVASADSIVQDGEDNVATQQGVDPPGHQPLPTGRAHGRALPK